MFASRVMATKVPMMVPKKPTPRPAAVMSMAVSANKNPGFMPGCFRHRVRPERAAG